MPSPTQRASRLAACSCALFAGCAFPLFSGNAPEVFRSQASEVEPTTKSTPPRRLHGLQVTELEESFDTVTVARTDGALQFHIATQRLCQTDTPQANQRERIRRGPCDEAAQPAAAVDVGLQNGPHLVVLGTTSQSGDFTLTLSQLDALFAGRPVELNALAQVIVHGRKAADLPLGEILNRRQQIDATLAASDRTLGAPNVSPEDLAARLAEVMDLKQQGSDDPRLLESAHRLFNRLHARESRAGDDYTTDSAESQDFDQALRLLPSMCKITVYGGEVVIGALVSEGFAVGMMLGVISQTIGDDLTSWLTNRCCEMAASSILHAESTVCNTDSP